MASMSVHCPRCNRKFRTQSNLLRHVNLDQTCCASFIHGSASNVAELDHLFLPVNSTTPNENPLVDSAGTEMPFSSPSSDSMIPDHSNHGPHHSPDHSPDSITLQSQNFPPFCHDSEDESMTIPTDSPYNNDSDDEVEPRYDNPDDRSDDESSDASSSVHPHHDPNLLALLVDQDDDSQIEYADDSSNDDERSGVEYDYDSHVDEESLLSQFTRDDNAEVVGLLPDVSVLIADRVFRHHLHTHSHPKYDINSLSQIKLLRILKEYAVPLVTFDSIIGWSKECFLDGYEFATDGRGTSTRAPIMKKIIKRYNHLDIFPRVEALLLPHCMRRVNMVYHNLNAMLYSLLSSPDLMKDHNLLFHNDDPFSPPPAQFTNLGDINTGRFYRETYKEHITPGSNKVLCPLILYMDETTTDNYGRLSITPLNFTLGIFKRKVRN